MQAELHDELNVAGFEVAAGDLGENVTTRGINLLSLPLGTRLHLGDKAMVEVTGLRNPCVQIERFRSGLLGECASRDDADNVIRKTGVMTVVIVVGEVRPGDTVRVELPPEPHHPLDVV